MTMHRSVELWNSAPSTTRAVTVTSCHGHIGTARVRNLKVEQNSDSSESKMLIIGTSLLAQTLSCMNSFIQRKRSKTGKIMILHDGLSTIYRTR